jgi:DNA polymerase-3 subunit epsilon
MNHFVAIDFETANADSSSICQIGLVEFKDGAEISEWGVLVNPDDYFDDMNVAIHGIDEFDVKNAPKFPDLYDEIKSRIDGRLVISHGSFDKRALENASRKYRVDSVNSTWLDSTRIVRRVLSEYSRKGYALQNLAAHFKLKTNPHDALDDARTCGRIVNLLLQQSNTKVDDWLTLTSKPIRTFSGTSSEYKTENFEVNLEGEYFGYSIAFTGQLESMPRHIAAQLASSYGFEIHKRLKKTTNFIVKGTQVASNLADDGKSSTERKAEAMLAQGGKIRTLSERDFLYFCKPIDK